MLKGGKEMKRRIITIIGSAAVTVLLAAGVSNAFTGEQYSKDAKISLDDARHIALKAFKGTIVSEELERERGGSGLRYSFDIRRDGVTHEVGVDAVTGKILENSVEGPNPD